jgi:dTDP-glucose pyrophosphorylase
MARNDQNYIIRQNKTILDAYKQIDSVSGYGAKVLFVSDDNEKIIGSLTDGDCRRAIISGKSLETKISDVMLKTFTYLRKGIYDIERINKIKKLGLQLIPQLNEDGSLYNILDFTSGRSFIPVDAVLMAGGKGERLRPLTLEIPKPLLKVDNKPIIDYNVDNLLHCGVEHINITVNYLAEQLEAHFSELNKEDSAEYTCIHEPKFLGTMGAVQFVPHWYNDTVLLMNSDLFTNINLEFFYRQFIESNADMSVACVPYDVNIPYGIFDFDENYNVIGLKEKPSYNYYANAGIYLFKREIIDLIPKNVMFHSTDMLELLLKKGKRVTHYAITGYWIDIGKPEDFKKVQEFARNINMSKEF